MSKLHEILAVEGSLEKAAHKLMKESLHTLDKESLFKGQVRKLEMFREEDKNSEITDYQELTTTVDENLDYLVKPLSKWLDAIYTKDSGNQLATSDLYVEGRFIAPNVPATFLLGLEKKLSEIRRVYEKIPTLEPGINWIPDEQNRPGIFKAEHSTVQMKSRKDPEFRTVAEATDRHPAQVVQVERTVDVGRYVTQLYSGKMTPLEKAERLERIDTLLNATKQARMKANSVEITNESIGEEIFNFINKG